MKTKTVRYAVVGCGDHAWRGHIEPALGLPGLELAALHDVDNDKMDEIERRIGRRLTKRADISMIYMDPEIDALVVASPDRFHAAAIVNAGRSGKHSLVEKPLAVSDDDLFQLRMGLDLAAEKGAIVTSCHPRRFDDLYIAVRERIPGWKSAYGRVLEMEFDFSYHLPSKTGLHTGLLMDHVNHEYDLMTFLLGRQPCLAHKLYDSQDRYQVAGIRRDEVAFSFKGTRRLRTHRYPEFLRLRFERADLTVHCENGRTALQEHEGAEGTAGATHLLQLPHSDYPAKFRRVMENFRDAILGKAADYLTPADLLENTSIGIGLTHDGRWRSPGMPG